MRLLYTTSPVVAGGCQEDGLISVGLIEQPLGQKGGVVVGVVVEAVPDGRLGHPVFYAGKTTRCQFLTAYTGSKFNSNFRRATCTGSTTSIAATYHNPTMSDTNSENATSAVENSDVRCSPF